MDSEVGVLNNVILLADSYKSSHYKQYPPGTSVVYSYFESRGGRFPYTVFFGLQYILKRWFCGQQVTREKIDEAKEFFSLHFNNPNIFNEDGWNYILEHHGGYLPVKICAVPEGSVVPTHNVLFTVENTDPKLPWLTSYLETVLVQCWYPMTVATVSRIQKQIIKKYLEDTHDNIDTLPFKLHDFGYRGSTSVESAGIGGAGHLVNFMGSDTLASIYLLKKFYNAPMAAFSIPAAEHSTITSWSQERETEAYENLLDKFPTGPVSVVNDSYNVFYSCEEIFGKALKGKIIENGKNGGVLVARPDSGEPSVILLKLLEIFEKSFGCEINAKGFKVLPPYLRIIQGDGINYRTVGAILESLKKARWSAENIAFGSGGALLQKLDRDTQKCAYKCSFAVVNGAGVNVFKEPITDPGKKSKKGRLSLEKHNGTYITIEEGKGNPQKDLLVPVYENGILLRDYTLDEIRERARITEGDIDILKFLEEDAASHPSCDDN